VTLSTISDWLSAGECIINIVVITSHINFHNILFIGPEEPLKETNHRPSLMSDDDLKNLIIEAAGGFIIVVECDRGQVLYVTDSIQEILNISQVLTYFGYRGYKRFCNL
jgi:hypothetical protein